MCPEEMLSRVVHPVSKATPAKEHNKFSSFIFSPKPSIKDKQKGVRGKHLTLNSQVNESSFYLCENGV